MLDIVPLPAHRVPQRRARARRRALYARKPELVPVAKIKDAVLGFRRMPALRQILTEEYSRVLWRARRPSFVPLGSCENQEEFLAFRSTMDSKLSAITDFEHSLLGKGREFQFVGWCSACETAARFLVDYKYCYETHNGRHIPNWRERLVCPRCHLNNRQRAAVSFLRLYNPKKIYFTEQATLLFRVANAILGGRILGSEYLRDGTPVGQLNAYGLRHEDATRLTFPDSSFDLIGSFDILEHVPSYHAVLSEFYRCLAAGGVLLLTAPFALEYPTTVTRARVLADGKIEHILEPQYHDDPLCSDGVLSFYDFGWDLLDELRRIGFNDVALTFYWSKELGHLGGLQYIICIRKN